MHITDWRATLLKPRFLMSPVLNSVFFINRVRVFWSPAFFEGKSECRVRVFLESGFCTGPSPVRVSQYAERTCVLVLKTHQLSQKSFRGRSVDVNTLDLKIGL